MNTVLSHHHTWAAQELATADLSDARLTKRLVHIVADKLAQPTASIPLASRSWAASKATYRFLSSAKVTPERARAQLQATATELKEEIRWAQPQPRPPERSS